MTVSTDSSLQRSPWLSVWSRPRDTIEWIIARDPRRHVILLACLGAAFNLLAFLISLGGISALLDWRVSLATAVAAVALGISGLYIYGLFLFWSGRLLRGAATQPQLRAVIAWGSVPTLLGILISLLSVTAIGLASRAGASDQFTGLLELVSQIVVVATSLWSSVATLLMLGRVQGFGFWRAIINYAVGAVLVGLLVALAVRTFLFQPFNIPSRSMMPTLLEGDYIFVSKFNYGYSRYSVPFSPPLFSGRVFGAEPQRGDLVVFRSPKDTSVDYIKRVVGLPNDRIQMIDGVLSINGTPVRHERAADFVWADDGGQVTKSKRWQETLPNGVSYMALDLQDHSFLDDTPAFTVPPAHYFVIGDNLDNSVDSRMPDRFGFVPFENLIGRVAIIYFSKGQGVGGSRAIVRFDRIGMTVR